MLPRSLLLSLLFCAAPAIAGAGPLEAGQAAMDDDDYKQAVEHFQAAYQQAPDSAGRAEAADRLGVAYCHDRQFWSGMQSFLSALTAAPDRTLTGASHPHLGTQNMGRCALQTSKVGRGAPELEAALRKQLGVAPGGDLNAAIKVAVSQGGFQCPKLEPVAPKVTETKPVDPTPATTAQAEAPVRLQTYAWVFSGVTVAAAGAAGVLGYLAYDKADNAAGETYDADIDAAKSLALGSNIAWGVTAAAGITAILLFVFDEDPSAEPEAVRITPTGTGLHVRF